MENEEDEEELQPWIREYDENGELTLINPDFDPDFQPEGTWDEAKEDWV